MKKIIFLLALSVFCFQVAGLSQTRVGLAGGVSMAKIDGKEGDGKAGIIISLILDAPLAPSKFSFHPVLSYVQKGQTEPHPTGTLIEKQYMALRYMELSGNFVYHIGGDKGGSFYIGAGPSMAFNIPSKRVAVLGGSKTTTDIQFGSTAENDLKGFDYSANFLAGLRSASGFFLTVNYNMGIRDLAPDGAPSSLKNRYIGVQLGYFLNNAKDE